MNVIPIKSNVWQFAFLNGKTNKGVDNMNNFIKPTPKKMLLPLDIQFFAEAKTDPPLDLKTLQTEFSASWKSLKTLLDQQADEMRTQGETHTKTADSITAIEKKIGEYEAELKGV